MRRHGSQGYAMLAALVVMVLASTFALIVAGAVRSAFVVERSDAAAWRASSRAQEAIAAVAERVRWFPGAETSSARDDGDAARGWWRASWRPSCPLAGDVWPRLRASVEAGYGAARHHDLVGFELRTESWASGVVCATDADVGAPLVVSGSGVYVGGCLRGREHVGFAQGAGPAAPTAAPADYVHGDVFAEAAVHAGAAVFAHGVEIHDANEASSWPYDTDGHAGVSLDREWLNAPSAAFLASAAGHGAPAGGALVEGHLTLDALAPPAAGAGGSCVSISAAAPVLIDGCLPGGARCLIVVCGDAVLGGPDAPTVLRGGLVVCGDLEIRGDVRLEGSLFAGSLATTAPASVTIASPWREDPLAGSSRPVITEIGG